MPTLILEAALRSLLMAVTVWAGMRLLRLHHVLAQKVAWVLVLLAAGLMPLVMRAPFLARIPAPSIPVHKLPLTKLFAENHDIIIPSATISLHLSSVEPAQQPAPNASHLRSEHSPKHLPTHPSHLSQFQPTEIIATVNPPSRAASSAEPTTLLSFLTWPRIASGLAIFYLAVAGFLLLRTLIGLAIATRLWLRAEPVLGLIGAEPALRIRVSPDLATPYTIARTVLLPADYESWDPSKLRIVLAHEQSHVRQRDFYLQLLAATHAAIFWFSPLGWWLQRKLSELGEALSDRAGLAQAPDASTYAQILLDFAAIPRTNSFTSPLAGVAMARTNNLSSRIDRILNDRRFRLDFLGGRRHAILAAILVPATLVAAITLIRVVPAVEAAQSATASISTMHFVTQQSPSATQSQTPSPIVAADTSSSQSASQSESTSESTDADDQVTTVEFAQDAPTPPTPPTPPSPEAMTAPTAPQAPVAPIDPMAPRAPRAPHRGVIYHDSDDDESFAIVQANGNKTIHINGNHDEEIARARRTHPGNFIWFEHDGKSYVIDDPAFVAQAEKMFKNDPELERKQAELDRQQKVLNEKMEALNPEMAKINLNSPEFKGRMDKLQAQLSVLQSDNFKKLSAELTAEKLGELQEKIGDIQGQIGELQGEIGEKQGELGEKQGAIGEQMGRLGEQMGRIGEEQGRQAEEASRKLKSILDQAFQDGKAKPVE